MKYHIKKDCQKSSTDVLDTCKKILMPNNYRLTKSTESEFVFEGGGMIKKGQNPLLGATKISVSINGQSLEINSELGGLFRSNLFIMIFPPALMIFLSTTFYFSGLGTQAVKQTLMGILPWLIISPLICYYLKTVTVKALDSLAHNIINA